MTTERFIKRCKRAQWYAESEFRALYAVAFWVCATLLGMACFWDNGHWHWESGHYYPGWIVFGIVWELAWFVFSWYNIIRCTRGWRHYRWRERLRNRPDMRENYRSEMIEAQARTAAAAIHAEQEQKRLLQEQKQHQKAVVW